MSAAKNKRAITVGIFIFIGLVILIIGVLTLGGQHKTFEKTILAKAVFDDVSGLQTGNNIWLSGVKIGTVKKIDFVGNSQVAVTMNLGQEALPYIHKDSKAKIGTEGLIGNKIVVIYGGTPQSPRIQAGDVLNVEKALSTDEMMATLQQNNRNLLDITNDFKTISKKLSEGQGTIGKLLNDETLVNSLQSTMVTLRLASDNAQRLTSNMATYTAQLQRRGTLANELVTDTTVFNRLRATSSQLAEVSQTANDVVNNLKTVSTNINNKLNSTNTPVGTLLNDQQAATDLKATLQNLQSGTQKLDENMEALQHNFLLKGYFKKKAKRAAEEDVKQKIDTANWEVDKVKVKLKEK